jgi:hypothetical protein
MQDPIQKTTKAERAEGIAHVAEHLPSKCKAPSSKLQHCQKEEIQYELYHLGYRIQTVGRERKCVC